MFPVKVYVVRDFVSDPVQLQRGRMARILHPQCLHTVAKRFGHRFSIRGPESVRTVHEQYANFILLTGKCQFCHRLIHLEYRSNTEYRLTVDMLIFIGWSLEQVTNKAIEYIKNNNYTIYSPACQRFRNML